MSSLLRFRQGIVVLFLAALPPVQLYGQAVELDSDADGLIDAWEIQHFGSLNHPDGAANLDPDEDTCTNLKECQDGTDPNDREDCLKAAKTILKPGELAITWNTRLGKRYQIELSDDLQTWKPVSDTAGTTPLNWFGTGGQLTVDFSNPDAPSVRGGVTREIWHHGSSNGSIGGLRRHINPSPDAAETPADGIEWRDSLKGPTNYGDNYGTRWRGFIVPKHTGIHNFYIAGRHQCEFWLDASGDPSDGIGLQRRCWLHNQDLTEEEDWDYLASLGVTDTQKSADLRLMAGRRYYFEIYHNHNAQWDHLAIGWEFDKSGTIAVVPGDCLEPLGDFVSNEDYTGNNVATLLARGNRKFVRVKTFGPLSAQALDADGDGVADEIENVLDGYQFFRPQSARAGASDGESLTTSSQAFPPSDVITVEVTDAIGRENNGTITGGIPRAKNVARVLLKRSGSLAPKNIVFSLNGPTDPRSKGVPDESDYVVELPDGTQLTRDPDNGAYVATLPFGSTEAVIELRPLPDEIVEYPEELNLVLDTPAINYVVGNPSQGAAELVDARDEAEFNKYYIGSFSKDPAARMPTSATGSTLLVLNGSNTVATVNDYFENLSSNQTNTHIHKASLAGITFTSGPVVESITEDGTENGVPLMGPVSNYTYRIEPRGSFSVQDIIDSLEFDNPKQGAPPGTTPLYNNKHTANNGGGEIWAIYQRRPASELSPEEGRRIPATPPIEPINPVTEVDKLRREVTRFLTQATFGPTEADIEELLYEVIQTHDGDRMAAYDAWLTAQWALPQTLVRDLAHAMDMQEFTWRGYFDSSRNGAANPPPVSPANWPSWQSQDISRFDSLDPSTWQAPDADFPLTAAQENALDNVLGTPTHQNRRRAQWTIMANARDQLRQRVGFALSEITVISENIAQIRNHHIGMARWADMLAENADDHFRELIEDVTYSPVMGKYLSHLQNSSEDSSGVPPDENYAREIMQLFTIGLFELWDDGFVKLDPAQFNLVPTYDNNDIKELARIMTGMSWSTNSGSSDNWDSPNLNRDDPPSGWYDDAAGNSWYSSRYNYPMAFYEDRHDRGNKTIVGGVVISNNGRSNGRYQNEGDKDLRDVHNLLAGTQLNTTPKSFAPTWSSDSTVNHQNTPVFISYRLIQRLVTSNPSGPYLYRVSQVWRDTNGRLGDVVRAILLDPEARNLSTSERNPEYGRKKEPIVAWIQALRAAGGRSRITFDGSVIPGDPVLLPLQNHIGTLAPTSDADLRNFDYPATSLANFEGMVKYGPDGQMILTAPGTFARLPATSYRLQNLDSGNTTALGQTPLKAPSVFNWFLPGYKPGGLIGSYGKVAPEFQIVTESSALQNINVYWQSHYNGNGWSASNVGGNNANSALAGYGTQRQYNNGSTTYTDDNIIPDYYAWINRYRNYRIDPGNPMGDEEEIDLQLIDDLDDLLLAGRFKLLYPVNPGDDGAPVQQGSLTHYPGRNPRETLLYYLRDTWSTNDDWQIWSKVRNALYLMATSPEYLIQK
ncbi:MAG: DUF1800 family protein [Roseibacillus sp.]|nr:DUF1800 family protein [Roseibacillus sp.]